MLGPVLYLELLLAGRRGKQYIFRWIYATWLTLQLLAIFSYYWTAYRTRSLFFYAAYGYNRPDFGASGEFATGMVGTLLVQEWILMALATPAFVAGAITDEKNRGTLQHMLTAHLTSGEIVLGKLLGRLAQVAALLLVDLPVLCFIGVFGGIHPTLLLAILVGTAAPMFGIGAASLLASVWCRTTRDAVVFLYAFGAVFWLTIVGLSAALPDILGGLSPGATHGLLALLHKIVTCLHPLDVLRPGLESGDMSELGRRVMRALAAWGTIGLLCLSVAAWRLRPAYTRQLESAKKKRSDSEPTIQRATVDEEPIRWKERTIEGIAPLAPLRAIPQSVGIVIVVVLALLLTGLQLSACMPRPSGPLRGLADVMALLRSVNTSMAGDLFLAQGIFVMLLASLIVGIRASGAVSAEREKQTWEALLLTPLQTRELVRGKLSGIFGASMPYLIAYAVVVLPLSGLGGFVAFFWTALWLGVTALAVYYIGAAGIWCSARSSTSWRSLLGTLGFGYLGGFLIFAVTSPATLIIAAIIYIFLQLADRAYGTVFAQAVGGFGTFWPAVFIASCVALAIIFFVAARLFLTNAEKRISDRERIRHWKDEPFRRPLRRRTTSSPSRPYY
jgi:ABC-type transport system involved in multi-copper enzyme maturation permease subunit